MNKLNNLDLALIPLFVALNVVIGGLIQVFKLPIYYDAVGTIIATIMTGFISGSVVGILSYIFMSIIVSPVYVYFIVTQVAIAGYVYITITYLAGVRSLFRSILTGIGLGVVAGVVSAPVIVYIFGGASGSGRDILTTLIAASGKQVLMAVVLSGIASEPIDKTIQVLTAVFLIRGIPRSLLTQFKTKAIQKNFSEA